MNELVIEQGTIIDRIDYNLESAEVHVSKGKQQLIKVDRRVICDFLGQTKYGKPMCSKLY
jgi:SNARE domain